MAAARRRDRRFTVGAASDDHFDLRPRAEGRDLKRKSALGKLQSDGTLMKLAALTPQQLAGPRRSRIDSIQYRTRPPRQPTPPLTSTEQASSEQSPLMAWISWERMDRIGNNWK